MLGIQDNNTYFKNQNLKNNNITLLFTFIFFLLGFLGIINHELWQDEMQAWMIAKDSLSIGELLANIKYEGHPSLWYLCLYVLTRFTHNPFAMQLFHLIIATVNIYIFLQFAPFTTIQKSLFIFGYFPLYEYSILSRNYSLGILLLFSFCLLFSRTKKNNFFLFITLALLAHTNAFGLIITIALTISFLLKILVERANLICGEKINIGGGIFLVTTSIIGAILQLIPPDEGIQGNLISSSSTVVETIFYQLNNLNRFMELLSNIWKSYFPLYQFSLSWEIITVSLLFAVISLTGLQLLFRQNKIIFYYGIVLIIFLVIFLYAQESLVFPVWDLLNIRALLGSLISLIILFFSSLLLLQQPIIWLLYLLGNLGILLFTHLIYYSDNLRHIGHFFFLFLGCIWLAKTRKENNYIVSRLETIRKFSLRYKDRFITLILVIQLITGIIAYNRDLFKPFSMSKRTAQYIEANQLDRLPIIGIPDERVCVLSGYLDKQFYYPQSDRMGSFVIWDSQRTHIRKQDIREPGKKQTLIKQNIFQYVKQINQTDKTNALLVSNSSIKFNITGLKIIQIKQFVRETISRENSYYLYLINFLN